MTRNRTTARRAGAAFVRRVSEHLAAHIDDRIEPRKETGAKDRGDMASVRSAHGLRVVVEGKDYGGRFLVGPWLAEADVERRNDDAGIGLVIAKRRGVTYPGAQVVFMTVDDLIALITGVRPDA